MSNSVRVEFPDSSGLRPSVIEYQGQANNLRELLFDLMNQNSSLKGLIDDKGKSTRLVNIYVNQENERCLQNLDTPIEDGDTIDIVTALSGG